VSSLSCVHSSPSQVVDFRVAACCSSEVLKVVPIVLSDNGSTAIDRTFIKCTSIEIVGAKRVSCGAEGLAAEHEVLFLLALVDCLDLADRSDKCVLSALCQVFQLVKVVAHLLLVSQLHRHHTRFKLLLLLVGAGLAVITSLFEKREAV
jgi:hypothetical protein